ncbi:MAG: phosphatidate cytidylyltransferase [Alphaproteobacteria bacterium]|nr:phosphatidate cytidylyltransferase [Alphaproteobacteria bacterium]
MTNTTAANAGMAQPAADPISSSLRTRVLSARVLLPVVLVLLYFGGLGFALLLALAAVLMAAEWDRLTGGVPVAAMGGANISLPGLALALSLLLVLFLGYRGHAGWALAMLVPLALILALLSRLLRRHLVWPVLGLFWLGLPCLALLWLRCGDSGLLAVSWLFLAVWCCDTGAYFAGRGIGGPKLAPRISPKKTWSGLLGGMLLAAIASALLAMASGQSGMALFALLGALLALVSQAGDLAESAVKRHFDVKDSGALIPGHGGILDRVDGILFAAPALGVITLASMSMPNLKVLPWQ